jgi:hypothetical protein
MVIVKTIRNDFTYKVVVLSENRATDKRYVDKVVNVTVSQREYNKTNAVNKIHEELKKTYDTKSRRYNGFEWVINHIHMSKSLI